MKLSNSGHRLWSSLFFKLLPYQILLLIVSAANGIVDSVCASNFIGEEAMNAIGLYSPLNHFLFALSIMLVSGSQLMVGKAMGKNETDSVAGFFSTDLILSVILSCIVSLLLIAAALTDAVRILVDDPAGRRAMNMYLIGQSFGLPALVLGQQLFAFLSLENQRKRTTIASLTCIAANALMDFLFVYFLKMGTFGLGLASSIGLWVFCVYMLTYYISGKSRLKFSARAFSGKDSLTICREGYTGAISRFVEMFRCIIINALILKFAGSSGISAFAAVNSVMAVFWPVVFGMVAVVRMLLSITIGEEDRRSLTDIMRVVLIQGGLLQCGISALIVALAVPFTNMFYHDPTDLVYKMTVTGFRLLPLCMPLAVLSLVYVCYAQAMENKVFSLLLALMDGAVNVVLLSFVMIPLWKMTGLYLANILNGVLCAVLVFAYASLKNKHFPKNMEELLVLPDSFGVSEKERIDMEIRQKTREGNEPGLTLVDEISAKVIRFSEERGIDSHRAYYTGLALEEMAGNVIEHGFSKKGRHHAIDIRVVHRGEDIILRILDNCTAFDPLSRMEYLNQSPPTENVGIRIVHGIAKDAQYQNLLGLNVLTLRI